MKQQHTRSTRQKHGDSAGTDVMFIAGAHTDAPRATAATWDVRAQVSWAGQGRGVKKHASSEGAQPPKAAGKGG